MSATAAHSVTLLEFQLDQQRFAIACELVAEVLPILPLRALPGAPAAIVGVTAVRGALLPLLDPRPRLGLKAWAYSLSAHIISVRAAGRAVGLVVDAADDVFTVPWADVCRPGALEPMVPYALGMVRRDRHQVVLVDLDALVTHDEWTEVARAVGAAR